MSLRYLKEEYHSPHIRDVIDKLEGVFGFTQYRPVRGDGNCFYRAFALGFMERCLRDPEEMEHLLSKISSALSTEKHAGDKVARIITHLNRICGQQQHAIHQLTTQHCGRRGQPAGGTSDDHHHHQKQHEEQSICALDVEKTRQQPARESTIDLKFDETAIAAPPGTTEIAMLARASREMYQISQRLQSIQMSTLALHDALMKGFQEVNERIGSIEKRIAHIEQAINAGRLLEKLNGRKDDNQEIPFDVSWMSHPEADNELVMLFRLLTAFSLNQNMSYFQMFLSEGEDILKRVLFVQKMGNEAEQLEIQALTTFLERGVVLYQVDKSGKDGNIPIYHLPDSSHSPVLYLLFRPGHYDLLCKTP